MGVTVDSHFHLGRPNDLHADLVLGEVEPPPTRDHRTFAIIGAAMAVHSQLGPGFLEAVYHEALEMELMDRHVPFVSQVPLPITYSGRPLKQSYRADLVCYGSIIVELKAISYAGRPEVAQLANYLAAAKMPLGLLLNFGASKLQFLRVIPWSAMKHREEVEGQPAPWTVDDEAKAAVV